MRGLVLTLSSWAILATGGAELAPVRVSRTGGGSPYTHRCSMKLAADGRRPMGDESQRDELGAWSKVGRAVWHPFVLGPGLIALILVAAAILVEPTDKAGRAFAAVLSVIAMLLTGLAGGELSKRWRELNEIGVLRAKGEGAVRGLNLVFLASDRLLDRLNRFRARITNGDGEPVTADNLEELRGIAAQLREGIVNAMEEWKGIVPSADVRAQIAEYQEQISIVAKLRAQIEEKEAEVEAARAEGLADSETEQANRELDALLTKLRDQQEILASHLETLGYTPSTSISRSVKGVSPAYLNALITSGGYWQCPICHELIPDMENDCPNCGWVRDTELEDG